MVSVAIDAMGGDFGEKPIIAGVLEALKERKDFEVVLVGDKDKLSCSIPENLKERVKIVHSDDVFSMGESATDVMKRKDSTIYKAVELVKNGECNAVVSAGHSGATMSLATLRIGRLKNVSRPPIATLMPNSKNSATLVLDVGANVDCKAEHLFQFAIMGEAYAKFILGIKNPRIGILSNGEEDSKGNEVTKSAFKLLKQMKNFVGNVEGGEIFDGSVDVVVCDGFMGNVVLKTSEGVASAMNKLIKNEIKKSLVSILGALILKRTFKAVKKSTDYEEYGGAPLLGVKNCVIIAHGKSGSKAIKNAIFQALRLADSNINNAIEEELLKFKNKI